MFKPQSLIRSGRTIVRIPIDAILPNPHQPRKTFPSESIEELAESIRRHGLLSPILVRSHKEDQYILIAGERRLKALRLIQRSFAEAVILDIPDDECALIALVENLQREDLHFLDEAEACRRILDECAITQERLAVSLSCSPSALANRLRLLKLPESVRTEIRRNSLSERHARALLKLDSEGDQISFLNQVIEQKLSVKQLESFIDRRQKQSSMKLRAKPSPIVRDNRIIINAVLDTVKELSRIGIQVKSRIEESEDHVDVIVRIPACPAAQKECRRASLKPADP